MADGMPPGLVPPSSIDALIHQYSLRVSNPQDALTSSLSLTDSELPETTREDVQKELDAVNSIARDLLRARLQPPVPNPPQQLQKNPRSDMVLQAKEQGNQLYRKGTYADAIHKYTMSIQFAASRPLFENQFYAREELSVSLCNRCAAYTASGQLVEALTDAEAVIKIKKNWPKGHFRKGKVLAAMGRLEEAKEAYLFGLEHDPEEKDLLAALADLQKATDDRKNSLARTLKAS